ncbi:MAG: tetratricopeptide repeat protein, partial [Pyrinomonadaceae bacterium]
SPDMKDDIGIAESVLALTLADQGKFDEAEKIVSAKLDAIRRQTNVETPEYCGALTIFGGILMEKGNYPEAEKNLAEAEVIYRKLYSQTYLPLGDNLRLQAQTFYFENNFTEAESKINETLEIYKKTGSKYINYPTALTVQGLILNKEGKSDAAEKVLREAVRIRLENLPKEHFLTALAESALGECLTTQRKYAEAETLLSASYENLKDSQGADNPRALLAQNRLFKFYESRKDSR